MGPLPAANNEVATETAAPDKAEMKPAPASVQKEAEPAKMEVPMAEKPLAEAEVKTEAKIMEPLVSTPVLTPALAPEPLPPISATVSAPKEITEVEKIPEAKAQTVEPTMPQVKKIDEQAGQQVSQPMAAADTTSPETAPETGQPLTTTEIDSKASVYRLLQVFYESTINICVLE